MNYDIGINAGKVYKVLSEKGELSLAKLKTETKLEPFALHSAIGWLARENKLHFSAKGKSIIINLK